MARGFNPRSGRSDVPLGLKWLSAPVRCPARVSDVSGSRCIEGLVAKTVQHSKDFVHPQYFGSCFLFNLWPRFQRTHVWHVVVVQLSKGGLVHTGSLFIPVPWLPWVPAKTVYGKKHLLGERIWYEHQASWVHLPKGYVKGVQPPLEACVPWSKDRFLFLGCTRMVIHLAVRILNHSIFVHQESHVHWPYSFDHDLWVMRDIVVCLSISDRPSNSLH